MHYFTYLSSNLFERGIFIFIKKKKTSVAFFIELLSIVVAAFVVNDNICLSRKHCYFYYFGAHPELACNKVVESK